MTRLCHSKGFSLVELSIALVIIGLLVGGILAGKSLIRASELRTIPTAIQTNYTAVMTFRDKYFQLPGDMNNAASFWSASCSDHTNNNCNGDGNGQLTIANCSSSIALEGNRAWQHMSLAGLIEGDFSGMNSNCANSIYYGNPGRSVPKLKAGGNVGMMMYYCGWCDAMLTNAYSNFFALGSYGGNALEVGFISPEEAWNIDTKIDDGLVNAGKMRGVNDSTALCRVGSVYNLTESSKACRIYFLLR